MKTFLKALVLLPLSIAVVLLAVANRGPVTLSLDPFGENERLMVSVPLFAVLFAAVALGTLIGGISTWLVQGRHRRAERSFRNEARRLRGEVRGTRDRPGQGRPSTGASGLPALPVPVSASGAAPSRL